MRLRTDDWWTAGRKRAVELGTIPDPRHAPDPYDPAYLAKLSDSGFEAAQEGDCWRLVWLGEKTRHWGGSQDGPLAGYVLTCPNTVCTDGVHPWDTARNCAQRTEDGRCPHEGTGSCWEWSGSPEDGTLSASPSLHCNAEQGGCGWHGFLRNGRMEAA